MKVIICGSRQWVDPTVIEEVLLELVPHRDTIFHGAAPGVDTQAAYYAKMSGFRVRAFPADWQKYGKAAGPIRNRRMLDAGAQLVYALHPDLSQSKGTKNMVKQAKQQEVKVKVRKAKHVRLLAWVAFDIDANAYRKLRRSAEYRQTVYKHLKPLVRMLRHPVSLQLIEEG